MKKRLFLLGLVLCLFLSYMLQAMTQRRTLYLRNFGFEESQYEFLYEAVERFNAAHPGVEYTLEVSNYTDSAWNWDSYIEGWETSAGTGEQTDLLTLSSDYIGKLAADGLLLPLDDVIADPRFQDEYLAPLLPLTQYGGHTWGLLVESDVRMVYLNRAILHKLGYSDAEIDAIPENVRMGKYTLTDLLEIGRKATAQGVAEYAVVHRPTNGLFFYMMAQQFGAFSMSENGEVSFDEQNFAEMLRFFQSAAQANRGSQPQNWSDVNDIFIQGRAAIYFGASWTIYDCVVEKGAQSDMLTDQYIACLIPAVEPGEAPFTMSNTMLVSISADCEYPEDVKEIIADAYSNWDARAEHIIKTYHMPVSKSTVTSEKMEQNSFLYNLLYMLDYTSFMPNSPDTQRWNQALHEAVVSVENGSGTPEEVAHTFAQDVQEE